MNSQWDTQDTMVRGDTVSLDIWYPRQRDVKYVEVGLMETRAADNIRISYDFERDGWKIEQASIFEWDMGETVFDQDWQEVAFVPAWARQEAREASLTAEANGGTGGEDLE